ncbi:MAG: guanylate kinase Gmk3 [Butyrivibrio sp.]|nr:guanylate kinase Gmk3 [Butyrivibrio sp.]
MITILIGKSAAGKDTYLNKCEKAGTKRIVTCTTRPKRKGEVSGRDYHFMSDKVFDTCKKDGMFVEDREYHTLFKGVPAVWRYGSLKVSDAGSKDYGVILDVDGALSYIEHYGPENIRILYLTVPDDIRRKRAKKRGSFDETEWNRRLLDDREKFSAERIDKLKRALKTYYPRNFKILDA